ncbi:hypothetical protein KDA_57000 [Dictyobacter alpinus]|uniref:Endo-beta-1,6-galactanase-like domain-containing protein n=1 Tax=Dictyobacter alpinus TaxID=2014873 RepID=A0A402BFU3_9CHLR|nr:glycoside hydrolase [Dictyobacter alpinus]GCE30216.1 hypothetical protein KDA_57000 [Dictyobacter alpinus]
MFRHYGKRIHLGVRMIALAALVTAGLSMFLHTSQKAQADYSISVDPAQQYQTIQGWGSSMAWWANWAGSLSDSQRVPLADKLFDPNTGIGLNVLRYNFGADGPGNVCHNAIANGKAGVYTNIPTYEPTAGAYDWTQDANQRWVLQAAQDRGANVFEGFVNSPPAWMTTNSCTSGANGNSENLSSSHYDDYTSYMATIAQHFHDTWGLPLQTLAAFNEPTPGYWNFNGDQEGSNISTGTQNTIVNKLAAKLDQTGVSAYSQISAPDDTAVNASNNDYDSYDANAKAAIIQYNTHTYGGSTGDRDYAYNTIGQNGNKRLWMSEWGTGAQSSPIAAGLTLSHEILTDEQHLHPASWVIWQAADNYANASGSGNGGSDNDLWGLASTDSSGNITYPSRYYALGNYSKFVRPGYKMIGNSDGNTFSAYDAGSQTLVLVTTNDGTGSTNVTYNLSNFSSVGGSATPYQTTSNQNLAQIANVGITNNTFTSTLPAQSITTFVIHGVNYTGTGAVTQVDDATQGSGLNQFNYSAGWGHCGDGCGNDQSGLYNGSNSWNGTAGATASVQFNGSRIRLFGVKDNNEGIATVSIDNGPAREVDFYAARRAGNQLMWESPALSSGTHTLNVTVTGRKNPQSSNVWPALDRVEIDAATTTATTLLANPGFESGNLSPWIGEVHANLAGIETNYPHSGSHDAYLHPTSSSDVGMAQTITAPTSRTYTLTAYAANNTGNVQLGVDVNGTQVKNIEVAGNVGYQQYTTSFTANAGQSIKIWYYAHAIAGWATLDDVSLT